MNKLKEKAATVDANLSAHDNPTKIFVQLIRPRDLSFPFAADKLASLNSA